METNKQLASSDVKLESSFADRLKVLMGNENESKFAQKCNIPLSTMRKYLSGSIPGLDKAAQIAQINNVSLEWLATGDGAVVRKDNYDIENRRIISILKDDQKAIKELDDDISDKLKPRFAAYAELKDIFSTYTEISKEIIATGLSAMTHQFDEVSFSQMINELKNDSFNQEFALIPGYRVQVSAGNGSMGTDSAEPVRHLAFRKKWLQFKGFNPSELAVVWAKGDSMHPTISDNDTLVVHLGRTKPKDGYIYVFRNGDELFVKRYQNILGAWRLISDNSLYSPIDIKKEDQHQFEVIGQVVHVAKDIAD